MVEIENVIMYKIKYDNTLIMLAKEPEFAEVFINFAQCNCFVDLFDMARKPQYKEKKWGANEFKAVLEMIDRGCPGLIEFKKKGWNGLWGFPLVRVTEQGQLAAENLKRALQKND